MKCDQCEINEAEIYIGYLGKNQQRTLSLCTECSETMGIPSSENLNKSDFPAEQENVFLSSGSAHSCSLCSTPLSKILSTGQAGCPQCYQEFKKEINRYFCKTADNSVLLENLDILSSGEVNEFVGH